MDVQVAEAGPCRKTLTIRIPPEQIRSHLERMFRDAADQVRMKGFRAGKVPRQVLEKKFGEQIRAEAKERLITESFRSACREHEIEVVGRPDVEGVDDGPLDEAQGIEFTVHVDVRPTFELGEITGIPVFPEPTDVSEEDVESALQQLADQKKTLDTVEEPIAEGDFFKAKLVFRSKGGDVVLEQGDRQLNPGIPLAGADPEEFRARVVGRAAGETVSLPLTFPPNFEVEAERGQEGTVDLTVEAVLRVQAPPLDDELAKAFDFASLDELREELRKRIGEEKQRAERRRQEEVILERLSAEHPFDVPEKLVEDQAEASLRAFEERLRKSGLQPEEVQSRVEAAREEALQDARQGIRMFFLVDAVAEKAEIDVDEQDIEVEVAQIAAQNGARAADVREYLRENGMLPELRLRILERKVREYLRTSARISDNTEAE